MKKEANSALLCHRHRLQAVVFITEIQSVIIADQALSIQPDSNFRNGAW